MLHAGLAKLEGSLLRLATIPGNHLLTRTLRQVGRGSWATLYHGRHPLSRGRRMRAIGNLWAWQALRRLSGGPLLVELQTGTKLLCPAWSTIAGAWVSIGVHETELFFVADVSRPGDVFVDVGANIGVYAVTAAVHGARAVAFEPTLQARTIVSENAAVNGVSERVTTSAFALADYDGPARFTVGQDCTNKLAQEDTGGVSIEVRTLDGCIAELIAPATRVDVIKIDVEGAEEAVLRGARATLERDHPTLIVEIWGGGGGMRHFLAERGYRTYGYDYERRLLRELPEDHTDSGNLVAIHAERLEATLGRLRAASRRQAQGPVPHFGALLRKLAF
jgi:FkbM family methyltransferase